MTNKLKAAKKKLAELRRKGLPAGWDHVKHPETDEPMFRNTLTNVWQTEYPTEEAHGNPTRVHVMGDR